MYGCLYSILGLPILSFQARNTVGVVCVGVCRPVYRNHAGCRTPPGPTFTARLDYSTLRSYVVSAETGGDGKTSSIQELCIRKRVVLVLTPSSFRCIVLSREALKVSPGGDATTRTITVVGLFSQGIDGSGGVPLDRQARIAQALAVASVRQWAGTPVINPVYIVQSNPILSNPSNPCTK